MIIGLTGRIAAGKSEVVNILAEGYGFTKLSFGEEVRTEAYARSIEITRENLQALGAKFTIELGESYWAKRISARINKKENHVIDGFRYPGQVKFFKELYKDKFHFLRIDARYETRLKRFLNRGRRDDLLTEESFREVDDADWSGGDGGQNVSECFGMADIIISNEDSLDFLKKDITKFLITKI